MSETKDKAPEGPNTTRSNPDLESSPRDRALEEVRAIRDENERRQRTHDRTEIHREVEGLTTTGQEKSKPMEIHVHGGVVYLDTHGEIRLDQDGVINLRHHLDAAFQAVS